MDNKVKKIDDTNLNRVSGGDFGDVDKDNGPKPMYKCGDTIRVYDGDTLEHLFNVTSEAVIRETDWDQEGKHWKYLVEYHNDSWFGHHGSGWITASDIKKS